MVRRLLAKAFGVESGEERLRSSLRARLRGQPPYLLRRLIEVLGVARWALKAAKHRRTPKAGPLCRLSDV